MKVTKVLFMVVRGLLLIIVGVVLWTIVGVNFVVNKCEDACATVVNDMIKMVRRHVKRHVENFAINLSVFADRFYSEGLRKAMEVQASLKTAFKLRRELLEEDASSEEEMIYYPTVS